MIGIKDNNTGKVIGVSHMPYRKKLCLTVDDGNVLIKYATFNNEESAEEFMRILAEFMGIENEVSE